MSEVVKLEDNLKLCRGCDIVKKLDTDYYKAGKVGCFQRLCKNCHNKQRSKWAVKSNYKKKGTGFQLLDPEIQKQIIYEMAVRVPLNEIAKKYNIKYMTFLSWKSKGKIVM